MSVLESIMEETHNRWQENGWSYSEFLSYLTTRELVVVMLAKLNYQVENGGFDQWFENGYGDHTSATFAALRAVNTNVARMVSELVSEAVSRRQDRDGDYDDLDSKYYGVNSQLVEDLEQWASTTATV